MITVKNICDYANYDRTTFYRYFNNTKDILNELEYYIINKITNKINKNINKNNKAYIKRDNFNRFSNNCGEYIVIFCKNNNYNFYSKFKNLIKNDAYNYFNINIDDDDMGELFFEFVFSSLIISYIYWYNHKKTISEETFVKFANNVLSAGINNILKMNL